MSGSATIIIASALPMSVLCTNTPEPGEHPDYSVVLVGERDPNALHGIGVTYGVDAAAFGEWIAANADVAALVRETNQAEIDAWSDHMSQYGFEAGLQTETGGGLGALLAARATVDLHALLALAGEQRRAAEAQLRQAEVAKRDADAAAEAATQARDEAEAAQKAAMAAIEAQAAPAAKP